MRVALLTRRLSGAERFDPPATTAVPPVRSGSRPCHISRGPIAGPPRCASGFLLAINELPAEARMSAAADLVLERERLFAGVRVDDVLEAELVVADALGDQVVLVEVLVRA